MSTVHISPYSGQWYPEAAAELEALLEQKYACSRARTGHSLPAGLGFVTPHAGPAYSGAVAAGVYRTLHQQRAERVVLLAFPHRGMLRGVATPDVRAIVTPLGEREIDRRFAGDFRALPEGRLCDHSFEIQLPFLQRSVPRAVVTPLYVGPLTAEERSHAAGVLAAAWQPGTVFVASSDFTHYGRDFDHLPFPSDRHTAQRLRDLDFQYIEAAGSLDACRFLDVLDRHQGTVCGSAPIALMLDVLRRLDRESIYPSVIDYQTSGEITGDFHHSVSYAALGFHSQTAFWLEADDCEALLNSAAETLRGLREGRARPLIAARGGSPALAAKRAAFVSLHRDEELLGCIGNLAGRCPLAEEIAGLTRSAAIDDPRFGPATSGAGPIDIEISLLTPFRRIYNPAEFCVGKHGGFLTLEHRSGLLLPQVAEGREWRAEDFIRALERKSNLWKGAAADPKAKLFVFEAQIFSRKNAVR
ncbi:MAG: AmmeMemoRadiSam system protein B [Candidatus Sulfopaludibacter sp.]|nr:AmmeMemoRadiSam system protein B [Candidatus Sulfopaludibacter sp.]